MEEKGKPSNDISITIFDQELGGEQRSFRYQQGSGGGNVRPRTKAPKVKKGKGNTRFVAKNANKGRLPIWTIQEADERNHGR